MHYSNVRRVSHERSEGVQLIDSLRRDIQKAQGEERKRLQEELDDFLSWDVCVCKRGDDDGQ